MTQAERQAERQAEVVEVIDAVDGTPRPATRLSVEEWIVSAILGVMVVVIFAQVVARYVFGSSFTWSEELARYAFIWLVFVGLGAVTLRGEHIVVDALTARLPDAARRVATQAVHAIVFAVNVLVIVAAVRMVYVLEELGQSSPALGLPMWTVYAAAPVGLAVASARLIQVSVQLWRTPEGS
jgi:C4-dicarboxylate transporter, DctQ subunit